MRLLTLTAMVILVCALAGEESAPSVFTRKPTVAREGEKLKISFALSHETDVAVYVENTKGEIVRHLVAGVLGKNAPAPLAADSLAQTLTWDGLDDDGKKAEDGPFSVRVGLGLKASWGGLAFADPDKTGPNRIENLLGMAAGPDGRIYVLDHCGAWLYWTTSRVHVFRRDGEYEKTIKPFSPNLPFDRIKTTGAFINSFGAVNPVVYRPLGFSFYTHDDVAHQPAVTPDGRIVLATRTANTHYYGDTGALGQGSLATIDADGGVPEASYAGPSLRAGWTSFPHLASRQDGKAVYISGLGQQNAWGPSKPWHAIYRASLPERGQEVFFGDPEASGADNAHLNDPRGLAVDGKGNLLVADSGNNRVLVLNEADKSVAGSFAVPAPSWLSVNPKTGAVYVQSNDAVIKYSGWQNATEQARLELAKSASKWAQWRFALDCSAEAAVLWAASGARLLRYEDQGTKFSGPIPARCSGTQFFWRPAVDPTRKLIACRIGGQFDSKLHILNEASGQSRIVGGGVEGTQGRTHRLGRDGSIYAVDNAHPVIRYDRDGKPKPFPATQNDPILKGRLPVGNTGTTAWERDFWVDRKGDIYVRRRGPQYHGHMTVEVYDQDGNFKRTVLWSVSDAMYGPRVDAKGNVYIMDMIKPVGELFPKEFEGKLTTTRAPHWYNWIYGSVVKFGPEGGAIWFADGKALPVTYEGWRVTTSNGVSGLKTTRGSLTGTIAARPAELCVPAAILEAATHNRIAMRLKNESEGDQATLSYHVVGDDKTRTKVLQIKPNSDFTEYTFDLAEEKGWQGLIRYLSLVPTNAATGSFSLDWFRIGNEGSKLVWNFDTEDAQDKKLPADMKKEEVAAFTKAKGNLLQGALWYRSGFSPVGMVQGNDQCHCTGSDFDIDDFGRVFAPDTGRFRVAVLDTNGNEILSFGAYGNQNFCGPQSYVVDPTTKLLRPRQETDPRELVSPFATPEIAFGWIVGLAVTDRYAYIDDVINKRILRVNLHYTTEEKCIVP